MITKLPMPIRFLLRHAGWAFAMSTVVGEAFAACTVPPTIVDTDRDGIIDCFDSAPTDMSLPGFSHLYSFTGAAANAQLGASLSAAGDVNNDGYPDLIVGIPNDATAFASAGAATVYSGLNGAVLYTITGEAASDHFGAVVSGAGDVNNDGYADVIVASPAHNSKTGRVKVYSGIDGSVLYTFDGAQAGDQWGTSAAAAGDVNNDGYADILVGAFGHNNGSGTAVVYSGKDGTILYTLVGEKPGDFFGYALAGLGDINKDGYADFAVGAPYNDKQGGDSGSVQVFSGKDGALLFTFYGAHAGAHFGYAVASAGDVNGDHFPDLVVGAPLDSQAAFRNGSATVFSGADGSVLYTFAGDVAGDNLGNSVSSAGDANGDGFADILVGIPSADAAGLVNPGAARIYSGKTGEILLTTTGDTAGTLWGFAVAGVGDVNHDGFADIALGSAYTGTTLLLSGGVNVISGAAALALNDTDGDGVYDNVDVCPLVSDVAQTDTDGDKHGDACDAFPSDSSRWLDTDGDGVADNVDNCPLVSNASQTDSNGNGVGDACDLDANNDGLRDSQEVDTDGDHLIDGWDPYPQDAVILNDYEGFNSLDHAGQGVAIADINGDGYADFIFGTTGEDVSVTSFGVKNGGSVTVISGKDGRTLLHIVGLIRDGSFGSAIAVVPDQNSDGVPDIVVGTPMATVIKTVTTSSGTKKVNMLKAGTVELYSGADGSKLATIANGTHAGDQFGYALAVGDVDGAAGANLVVGAPYADVMSTTLLKDAGQVTVYTDVSSGVALYTRAGTQKAEHFGAALGVDAAQQLLLVGSPAYDYPTFVNSRAVTWVDAGRVQVFPGGSGVAGPSLSVYGAAAKNKFGSAIAVFGADISGDAQNDWAVGSPGARVMNTCTGKNMTGAGQLDIYSGLNTTPWHTHTDLDYLNLTCSNNLQTQTHTATSGDGFGYALAAGDLNHDGKPDLVIGRPWFDHTYLWAGTTLQVKDAGFVQVINANGL